MSQATEWADFPMQDVKDPVLVPRFPFLLGFSPVSARCHHHSQAAFLPQQWHMWYE